MSLKNKAISGFSWSLAEGILSQGIIFVVGILLARILSPSDFGLIGLTTVFISLSNTIINSGFSYALIRKENVSVVDYSTIFYVNIFVAFFLYLILFVTSSFIASYFEEPLLENIIKIAALIVFASAFSLVQRSKLTHELNFKLQSKITIFSSFFSGIIALLLAYLDYGVWALVFLSLIKQFVNCLLLWFLNKWKPILVFSLESFKELFSYSYKLLLADLINSIYGNIYYVIIGKVYSPLSLGYYTRANDFQRPFSLNIGVGIRRISFPILSKLQGNKIELKSKFVKFIRVNTLLSSAVMFFIAAIAKPMILVLIGQKWEQSIFYTQLLCVTGLLYGVQILNLNLLNVLGLSNLNLKLEILKKIILVPIIALSAFYSIDMLLYGLVLFSFIELFVNSFYTVKLIDYQIKDQLKDIGVFIAIGLGYFIISFPITLLNLSYLIMLTIQVVLFIVYYSLWFIYGRLEEFSIGVELFNKLLKK